ncbi:MAG TPA: histidine phosphatase family protein [Mycobacterium sp.]|jgi:phosphohistidine phosphatase|nr:histidine phosphatase family protein [Mycobacterium sp.]
MSAVPTPPPTARTLVLLRHGKSAYPPGVGDHERPLAPRGRRQAGLAGQWIADNLAPIDHVICSTAERTRQTLEASGLATPTALVDFTDQVYGAEPEDLVPLIAAANAADRTLLVVGHAPGLPDLADELAGKGSDPSALSAMRAKYPTSAVAVLELDGDWADIAAAPTRLVDFVVARS